VSTFVRDLQAGPHRKRVGRKPRVKVSLSDEARALLLHAARVSDLYVSDVLDALIHRYVTFPEGEGPEPPELPVGAVVEYQHELETAPEPSGDDDEDWLEGI